jgi:hypothetical protein
MYIAQTIQDPRKREDEYQAKRGHIKKFLEWSLREYMHKQRLPTLTLSWDSWVALLVKNPPSYYSHWEPYWPYNMDMTWKTIREGDKADIWQWVKWNTTHGNYEALAEIEVGWDKLNPQMVTATMTKLYKTKSLRTCGSEREVWHSVVDETFTPVHV